MWAGWFICDGTFDICGCVCGCDIVPIFGGGVMSIPESAPELPLPSTELTGAGALEDVEHPANQSETSDNAAMRLTVNLGLPALIYPPTK